MEWLGDIVPEGTWTTSCFLTSTSTLFFLSLAASSTLNLLPQHTIANRIALATTDSKHPQHCPADAEGPQVPQNVETALALYVEEASVPNPVQFIVM